MKPDRAQRVDAGVRDARTAVSSAALDSMLHLRRLDSLAQLAALRDSWNRVAGATPFGSWQWLHSWAETFLRDAPLETLAAETPAGELVGLLPLYRDDSLVEGRVLRLLGSGAVCTDYLSAFALPEHGPQACAAFAAHLTARADDRAQGWDALHLEAVPSGDPLAVALAQALAERGAHVETVEGPNCWRIALPPAWDEYLAGMSKSHRKQIRRLEREYLETGQAVLHVAQTEAEFEQSWGSLVELHQKRRRQLGQPGCFACERFTAFLELASRRLLAAGQLRLARLDVAGRPVAAEWQVCDGPTQYAYQAGVDPDALELEPGRLIMLATIRQALEQGRRGFDFLRGDEPYKAHFRATPQPTTHWRIVPPTPRAAFRRALGSVRGAAKRWWKATRGFAADRGRPTPVAE